MKLLFTLLFSTCTWLVVCGQVTEPIDLQVQQCLDTAATTIDMIDCQNQANKAWDAELNKYYKLYSSALTDENRVILKNAQRKWIEYRDSEYYLIDAHYYNQLEGSMWHPIAAGEKMKFVRDRALQLKSLYEELASLEQ